MPMMVRIEKMPRDIPQDPDYRMPIKSRRQLKKEGYTFDVVKIPAQVVFGEFENLAPKDTGSDLETRGRLVTNRHSMKQHDLRPNDFFIQMFVDGKWRDVEFRIFAAIPSSQDTGGFKHYFLYFADDPRP